MKARGFQNVIPPAAAGERFSALPQCHSRTRFAMGPPMARLRRNRSPLFRPRRRGNAFPLDKARLRGIMKIQKGAVDLTVGPMQSNN